MVAALRICPHVQQVARNIAHTSELIRPSTCVKGARKAERSAVPIRCIFPVTLPVSLSSLQLAYMAADMAGATAFHSSPTRLSRPREKSPHLLQRSRKTALDLSMTTYKISTVPVTDLRVQWQRARRVTFLSVSLVPSRALSRALSGALSRAPSGPLSLSGNDISSSNCRVHVVACMSVSAPSLIHTP